MYQAESDLYGITADEWDILGLQMGMDGKLLCAQVFRAIERIKATNEANFGDFGRTDVSLVGLFIWRDTKEGFEFWDTINSFIQNKYAHKEANDERI